MSDPLRQLIVEIVREVVAEQPRPDEMMTVAAAAEFAKVSPATIRKLVHDGKLEELRVTAGSRLRISRADLERHLRTRATRNHNRRPDTSDEAIDAIAASIK